MHIIPTFGAKSITEITRRDIQEFLAQQKKDGNIRNGEKLSATSTNMMLSISTLPLNMPAIWNMSKKTHVCECDEQKKIEAFTVEEQRAIEIEISYSDDRRLHGILLCLYTGLRIGELLGLTWNDIDLERGVIKITKTVYREKDESGTW